MSVLTYDQVYRGFWINYSKGSVLGSTITTTSERANVIVAILSVSIAFAGSHLWDIIAFLSFASQATHAARDGVHHQRQAMLRNVSSPSGIILKTVEMYWKWRNHKTQPLTRLVYLCLTAILCSLGFLVAGILSSQVVSTASIPVLAQTDFCGFVGRSKYSSIYSVAAAQSSARYATNCYNGSRLDPSCQVFTTQAIPFTTSYADCPFDSSLCILDKSEAIRMDTGQMWSDDVFGINAKRSDAIALRKVTTCAPLDVSQHMQTYSLDDNSSTIEFLRKPFGGENLTQWYLGSTPSGNATWELSNVLSETISEMRSYMGIWTHQGSEVSEMFPWADPPTWEPIEAFQSTRADTGDITLLINRINMEAFPEPVDDPLFGSHKPIESRVRTSDGKISNRTLYRQDDASGVVACTDQAQFCDPSGRCTALTSPRLAGLEAASFGLNERANVTLYSFLNSLINHQATMAMIDRVNPMPFIANSPDMPGFSFTPHPNQWEMEMKYWQSIALAMLQKTMSDVAAGQGAPNSQSSNVTHLPAGPGEDFLCHAQKMMAPHGFSNVNVFGLSLIIAVCGLIISANFILATLLRWMPWNMQQQRVSLEQWHEDDILTFQRLAFESNGIGAWRGMPNRVPVTTTDEPFKRLADVVKLPTSSSFQGYSDYKDEKQNMTSTVQSTPNSERYFFKRPFRSMFSPQIEDVDSISYTPEPLTADSLTPQTFTFNLDDRDYRTTYSPSLS